jgi:putative membrane protein
MGVLGLLATVAVVVVACLHLLFFVLESFLWTTPFGRRTFGLSKELAEGSKSLAQNQGLYNAFLATGLIWGLCPVMCGFQIKIFFLACVIIAGIVGGLTAKRSILVIQALPGVIALVLVYLSHR